MVWCRLKTRHIQTDNSIDDSGAAALGKALATGLSGFVWSESEALRGEKGEPYFHFSGALEYFIRENHLKAHLSLTHEGGFSTALVVLEQE